MKTCKIFACVLGSMLLIAVSSTHAQWHGKWVTGVSAGIVEDKGNLNLALAYTRLPLFPLTEIIHERTDKWTIGGILAGYQANCAEWQLSSEFNLDWYKAEQYQIVFTDAAQLLSWRANIDAKGRAVLGLTESIGYKMAPYFIPYIRLGVELSKVDFAVALEANALPIEISIQDKGWKYRFVGGFGTEIPLPIFSCPSIRLEYIYRCYFTDKGIEASAISNQGLIQPALTVQTHPRTQTGKVSLVWHF